MFTRCVACGDGVNQPRLPCLRRGFAADSTKSAAPLPPLPSGGSLPSLFPSGVMREQLWAPPVPEAEEEGFQLMAVPKRKVSHPFLSY